MPAGGEWWDVVKTERSTHTHTHLSSITFTHAHTSCHAHHTPTTPTPLQMSDEGVASTAAADTLLAMSATAAPTITAENRVLAVKAARQARSL